MLRKSTKATVAVALLMAQSSAIKFRPPPGTVPWKKKIELPEHIDPQDHELDYFVPNFGADDDVISTKKNLAAAEEELGHVM